jgi:Flp pilus assembly protein TadD/O-antigen ligase
MKLPNKKIKHIKRHASTKTPDQIAGDLRISVKDIQKVLNRSGVKHPRSGIWLQKALDRVFPWGLIVFSFLSPFVFLREIHDFAKFPKMAFIQVGVLFFFLIWLARALMAKNFVALKSPFDLPIIAFVLWCLVSVIYAHNRYEGLVPWFHWAASALVFFLVINGIREEKHRVQLLAAVFVSGVLCAILGIVQYLFCFSWIPQSIPPAATFANKNMAVHFIVLAFPLGVGFLLNNDQKAWDWILSIASGLMILFLVYSATRAGWLALTVEILLLFALVARDHIKTKGGLFWNYNKTLATGASLLILLIMINMGPRGFKWGMGQVVDRAATVIKYEEESTENEDHGDESIALRIAVWKNTLEMIKDNFWIGLGLGNHKVVYPLYHRKVVMEKVFSETVQLYNVHNDYLQAFAELGLAGILLLCWSGFVFVRLTFGLLASGHPRETRFFTIAIVVAIIGLLVNAFFSFPFQRAVPPFVLMIFLGILTSWHLVDKRKFYEIKSRSTILFLFTFAFILWVCLIRFHYLSMQCKHHFFNITRLDKSKNWEQVIAEAKKAFAYNPHEVRTLSLLARAYLKTGRYREAIEPLATVIEAYPNDMNAHINMGIACDHIGDYTRALNEYEKALRIQPDFAKAHNNMGITFMKQKKPDRALEQFQKAIALDPKNSSAFTNIGIVAMRRKQYPQAAEAFEKAVELNPGSAVAQKNLGYVYFKFLNKKKDGLDHLRAALTINPNVKNASRIRKLIKDAEKDGP